MDESFCRNPDNRPFFEKIINSTRERARTLDECFEKVHFVFQEKIEFPEKESHKVFTADAISGLKSLQEFAEQRRDNPPSTEEWEAAFKQILETHNLKMKTLAQAVRLSLTGTLVSPPIFDVIDLLESVQSSIVYNWRLNISRQKCK